MLNLVRGIPGRIRSGLGNLGSLLYNSGRAIIQGLINGILNMMGNVKSAIKSVLNSARNMLPFSPAKEGPFSGRGWTLYSGQSIVESLAQGVKDREGMLRAAVQNVVSKAQFELNGVKASGALSVAGGTASADGRTLTIENVNLSLSASFDLSKGIPRDFVVKIREAIRQVEKEYK
jgi:hypothetical protein